jgi:putative ABC transport system ATP-binding protein
VTVGEGFRFEEVGLTMDDGTSVLREVDAELPGTGITALVGPSGSGKSTLLRCCNRLEVPTSGRVLLDGVDLSELDPLLLRRRVGMVFQRAVPFEGTVAQNLRVADASSSDEGLSGALRAVDLRPSILGRSAAELSGGECQRMCLARTLLTDPAVVLMDEVTSSLDVDTTEVIERLTRRLADSGRAVVWVTHDLAQAARLADRTIVVIDGTVAADAVAERCLREGSFRPAERGRT